MKLNKLTLSYPRYMLVVAVSSLLGYVLFNPSSEQAFIGAAVLGVGLELVMERLLRSRQVESVRSATQRQPIHFDPQQPLDLKRKV